MFNFNKNKIMKKIINLYFKEIKGFSLSLKIFLTFLIILITASLIDFIIHFTPINF